MLRIQVRVAARDAAKQLLSVAKAIRAIQSASTPGAGSTQKSITGLRNAARSTSGELKNINRNLLQLSGKGTFTTHSKDAEKYTAKLRGINKNLKELRGAKIPPWSSQMSAAPFSKWSPAIAKTKNKPAVFKPPTMSQLPTQRNLNMQKPHVFKPPKISQMPTQQNLNMRKQAAFKPPNMSQLPMQRNLTMQANYNKQVAAAQKAANTAAGQQQRAANTLAGQQQRAANKVANNLAKQAVAAQKASDKLKAQNQAASNKTLKTLSKQATDAIKAATKADAAARKAVATSRGLNAQFGGRLGQLDTAVNGITQRTKQGMIQTGKNMQWVGRQINYNFVLPMIAAGRAALRWELDNERAFARLKKVYGDSTQDYTAELGKVGTALELLSGLYGVNQAEVIALGGQWAAAGLSAGALAKAVENSLKLSLIGDYQDLASTFTDLVTIQQAFRLSSQGVTDALATMNTVENMTAITMQQLVTGVTKVGGAASVAGIDIRHLSGMMAALVPATGSAETAGTALQTIFARLKAPTSELIVALKNMGIEWGSTSFQMLDGSQQLELMAQKFATLTSGQQANVAAIIGSRRQYNKLITLLRDMGEAQGIYNTVLKATDPTNATAMFNQMNKEIQTMLSSSPKRLEILKSLMQNSFADMVQPMLPALLLFAGLIQKLVGWFAALNPGIQTTVFVLFGLIATVGILAQVIGSFQLLFGQGIAFVLGFLRMLGIGTVAVGSEIAIATAEATAASTAMAAAAAQANLAMFLATAQAAGISGAAIAAVTQAVAVQVNLAAASAVVSVQAAEAAIIGGLPLLIAAIVIALVVLVWVFRKQIGRAFMAFWDWAKEVIPKVAKYMLIALSGPLGWLVYLFHKQIGAAFGSFWEWGKKALTFIGGVFEDIGGIIVDAWGLLPRAVAGAFNAVARIISGAMKGITRALSYLNPFARHSPSLVDNVKAGVAVIAAEYASLGGVMGVLHKATVDLKNFADATKEARAASKGADRATQRAKIVKGADPRVTKLGSGSQKTKVDDTAAAVKAAGASVAAAQKTIDKNRAAATKEGDKATSADNRRAAGILAAANANVKARYLDAASAQKEFAASQARVAGQSASSPINIGAGIAADALYADLDSLNAILEELNTQILTQTLVVEPLKAAYEAADWAVQEFEASMGPLKVTVDALANSISEAKSKISEFANMPIAGMKAMNDAIWANNYAQTKLKLEIMDMADAGASYDKIKDKLAALQGDIETTQATMKDLREAGAGSDVLSAYQDQLDGLTAQKDALDVSGQHALDLANQLDDLQLAGERLDLEKAFKFDPLIKQIDDLADVTKEISFDEIIKGISDQREALDDLTAAYTPQKAALDKQQKVLDKLVGTRDKLKAAYDVEDVKLQHLKGTYSDVTDKIKDIESALDDATQAMENLSGGGGGPAWDELLGTEELQRVIDDQEASIDQMIKDMQLQMEGMFDFDILGGIWRWIGRTFGPIGLWFTNLPSTIAGWMREKTDPIWQAGKFYLGEVIGGIGEKAVELKDWFAALPAKIKEWVTSKAGDLWSQGRGLLGGLWEGVKDKAKDAFNAIAGYWNKTVGSLTFEIPWWVPKIGGVGWSVPDIPVFHDGGVVPGAIGKEVPALLQAGETVRTLAQEAQLQRYLLSLGGRIFAPGQTNAAPQAPAPTQTAPMNVATNRTTNITLSGDLSFPNISSHLDAERFISNLEMLAGV